MNEENGEAVRLLIDWFYTQILETQQPEELLKDNAKDDEDLTLIQLWILADRLIIPELQNLVIDEIDLDNVYNNTTAGSPFRRWLFTNVLLGSSWAGSVSTPNTSHRRCSLSWPPSGAGTCRNKPRSDSWMRLASLISRLRFPRTDGF